MRATRCKGGSGWVTPDRKRRTEQGGPPCATTGWEAGEREGGEGRRGAGERESEWPPGWRRPMPDGASCAGEWPPGRSARSGGVGAGMGPPGGSACCADEPTVNGRDRQVGRVSPGVPLGEGKMEM